MIAPACVRDFLASIEKRAEDDAPRLVFADWLDDNLQPEWAELLRLQVESRRINRRTAKERWAVVETRCKELRTKLPLLAAVLDPDDYDWKEAFAYAGDEGHGGATVKRAAPMLDVDESPFRRRDVCEVIAVRVGQNDGDNWVCVGRLYDGRWFALDAGCDYTGWD